MIYYTYYYTDIILLYLSKSRLHSKGTSRRPVVPLAHCVLKLNTATTITSAWLTVRNVSDFFFLQWPEVKSTS